MEHKKSLISNGLVQGFIIFFSLLIASVLIGKFTSTFVLSFIVIASFSLIYSLVTIRKFGKELIHLGIKVGCILSLSFLTGLLFAIILPYLFFHDSFFDILVIACIYSFSIILVFLISSFLYSALINRTQIKWGRIIKVSLFFTIIISLVLFLIYVFSYTYIYNRNFESYYKNIKYKEESYFGISEYETIPETVNLELFDQLKSYQSDLLNQIITQKNHFEKSSNDRKLCLNSDCTKDILDQAYHSIEVVVSSTSIKRELIQVANEFNYINSEGFKQNFTSLEEYKTYLVNEVESLGSNLSLFSNEFADTMTITESDITYNEFKAILQDRLESESEGTHQGYIGYPSSDFIARPQSLFQNSLSYLIQHSNEFKELFNFIIKVEAYTKRQGTYPDVFVYILGEKDIEECIESKAIRYKLILTHLRIINER